MMLSFLSITVGIKRNSELSMEKINEILKLNKTALFSLPKIIK